MINSASPKDGGNREKTNDALKRIQEEYGKKDDKAREPVKKLGKDDFFRIMVTQIKNQDPTKPYDNEQMASQMAQFTSLEQMINVNANLVKLAEAQQPLHHMGAAGLMGKWVTTDMSRVSHTEGKWTSLSFDLPADAANVKVALINEKGETVRELEKKDLKKGVNKIDWDGRRSNNMQAPSGAYTVQVRAENARGQSIPVNTNNRHQVVGVSFEGKETVLLVGDPKSPQKVMLKAISRIESEPSEEKIAGLVPRVAAVGQEGAGGGGQTQGGDAGEGKKEGEIVVDADPGQSGKYTPLDMNVMKALMSSQEPPAAKPSAPPVDGSMDLSAANPNAALIAGGGKGSVR